MATKLVVPRYEHPLFRFLAARGELALGQEGHATSLGELLTHTRTDGFPVHISALTPTEIPTLVGSEDAPQVLRLEEVELSRRQLLIAAYRVLEGGGTMGYGTDDVRIRAMIREELGL